MTNGKKNKPPKARSSQAKSKPAPTAPQPTGKDDITREEFDEALEGLLDEMSDEEILATPGAYEVFSEALNNEAIALAREIKEEEEDDNDDDEKT